MADKQEKAAENNEPIEVKTSEKSPDDLADEIAKAAATLGGASPKDKADGVVEDPGEAVKVTVGDSSTEEEVLETKIESTTDVTEETNKAVDKESDKSVSEVLHGKKEVDEMDEEKKSKVGHRGKTLTPIKVDKEVSESQKKQVEKKEEKTEKKQEPKEDKEVDEMAAPASKAAKAKMEQKETPEPEPEPEPEKKQDEKAKEPAKEDEKPEAAQKLDAMTGELKARENEKAAAKKKKDDQHEAKIYDTKKYHLPIKANKHHRKSALPAWAQWVILVIAVGGMIAYGFYIELFNF